MAINMKTIDEIDKEILNIIELSANCDQGKALHRILDLLLVVDMDDHQIEDPTDDELDEISEAETFLFHLACAWSRKKHSK